MRNPQKFSRCIRTSDRTLGRCMTALQLKRMVRTSPWRTQPWRILTECMGLHCPFFRHTRPVIRNQIIRDCITWLSSTPAAHEDHTLCFVGAGGMLQELLITIAWLRVLNQNLTARSIAIYCIDSSYATHATSSLEQCIMAREQIQWNIFQAYAHACAQSINLKLYRLNDIREVAQQTLPQATYILGVDVPTTDIAIWKSIGMHGCVFYAQDQENTEN